ncbi:hypothetical protein ACLB2K_000527 [Fragaria x ananassa]
MASVDSVLVVFILMVLLLIIYSFQDKITKPGLAVAIDIVASILMLVVLAMLRTIMLDSIYSPRIITVIYIGLCFTAVLNVSNIFIIGFNIVAYCLRRRMRLMQQELYCRVEFPFRRPEGYVILSYQMDLEMGFCDGECAICLMEFEEEDECALLDKSVEGVQLGIMILAVVALLLCVFLGAFALIPSGNTKNVKSNAKAEKTAKIYTKAEVSLHNKRTDCWVIIKNKVYDLTPYVEVHPGGDAILAHAGDDSTVGFYGPQHASLVYDMVHEFYIGDLEPGAAVTK